MKIITWNVNGIRAIERKGEMQAFIDRYAPEVFMIQEIKGTRDQFSEYLTGHTGYRQFYSSAGKKGYAGTGIWISEHVAEKAGEVLFSTEIPHAPNADEGRLSQLTLTKDDERWELLSIYFPNGGKSQQAWQEKLEFYDRVHDYINQLRGPGSFVLVGGDMNVAHTEIDIARPKENDGKIGFHPLERAWMDRLAEDGWVDVWRDRNPQVTGVYSWWHMISRSRERNVGWRIDYFLTDRRNMPRVKDVEYLTEQMGSDHCPLCISLK